MIEDSQLDLDDDQRYWHEGRPFSGVGYEVSADGTRSETSYVDGWQEGPATDFYPDGGVKSVSNYRANLVHGYVDKFSASGTLQRRDVFEYGFAIARWRRDVTGGWVEDFSVPPESETAGTVDGLRRRYRWPVPDRTKPE
jgi:hypothetical protein